MNNKINRWLDVQVVIVALALTFTLALWNIFSGGSQSAGTSTASQPRQQNSASTASQGTSRIFLGGAAPQPRSLAAPAPVTITGSSRP
jgi:hypothetical protein